MFKQITLPYAPDALEPYIDQLTVETHHGKHHATYTKAFNEAVEKAGLEGKTAEEILSNLDQVEDEALRNALRNNGGGYYNHNLYFAAFSPNPAKEPDADLKARIDETFGGLDNLKAELKKAATGRFGSGWAWLNASKDGSLCVTSSLNQDNPYSEKKDFAPILALDVWEHAYYLKYKNLRPDYIDNYFEILDWAVISENYKKVQA